ncbi:MAG: HepT-like ribonuclease domain-containing protein [Bacteroidota bacterium]
MRNIVSHEYFGVDADVFWKTIKIDLAVPKESIVRLLGEQWQRQ